MKQFTSLEDVKHLGTILSIWAHPDDETFLAGGVLATAVSNGQTVVCITATKGEAGEQYKTNYSPEELGEVRSQELERALEVLGVKHQYFLGCEDGCCCDMPESSIVPQLSRLINRYNPDTILTFGPDGWSGHPDHIQVSKWVSDIVTELKLRSQVYHVVHTQKQYDDYLKQIDKDLNFFFNTDKPPISDPDACAIYFQLPAEISNLKCQALKAMSSQTGGLFETYSEDFICQALGLEAFVRAD